MKECLGFEEGFGGVEPARDLAESLLSTSTVIQVGKVHRKDGVKSPRWSSAAALHQRELMVT